jgi:hypothetical protein
MQSDLDRGLVGILGIVPGRQEVFERFGTSGVVNSYNDINLCKMSLESRL